MRLIDRSILLLQSAEQEAAALKARAYAIAPWLVNEAVADRPPDGGRERGGGHGR